MRGRPRLLSRPGLSGTGSVCGTAAYGRADPRPIIIRSPRPSAAATIGGRFKSPQAHGSRDGIVTGRQARLPTRIEVWRDRRVEVFLFRVAFFECPLDVDLRHPTTISTRARAVSLGRPTERVETSATRANGCAATHHAPDLPNVSRRALGLFTRPTFTRLPVVGPITSGRSAGSTT